MTARTKTIGLAIGVALLPTAAMAQLNTTSECWSCDAVIFAVRTVEATSAGFPGLLAAQIWPLIRVAVLAGILWELLKALATGYSPLGGLITGGIRLLVLSSLLGSPADIGQLASQYLLQPAIAGGAGLGSSLAEATSIAGGVTNPNGSTCTTSFGSSMTPTDQSYETALTQLVALTCTLHQVGMVAYDVGAVVASQQMRQGTNGDLRLAIVYNAVGILMMYAAFCMVTDFALTLVEVILRAGTFVAFIPFTAIFWTYQSTRNSAYRAFTNMLFVFTYLTLTGISATVASSLLMLGMQLGLGAGAGPMQTPSEILTAFTAQLTSGSTINDNATLGDAMRFVAYVSICTTIALGVQRGVHQVAMEITQYEPSKSGDRSMAIAAMSSINTVGGIAGSMMFGGSAGLGRLFGRIVSRKL